MFMVGILTSPIVTFYIDTMEFIVSQIPKCRPTDNDTIPNHQEYRLGCHCIELNIGCRKILWYLILDGRFNVKSNTQVFYREAKTNFAHISVENFDEMIQKIVRPIFSKRFSTKNSILIENNNSSYSIVNLVKSEDSCLLYGPKCHVALRALNEMLNKIFRNVFVLNKDLRPENGTLNSRRERYYGTMLANSNFDHSLDIVHGYQKSPETFQLHNDLTKLFGIIFPTQNLSLVQFLGILGYDGYDWSDSKNEAYFKLETVIHPLECTPCKKISGTSNNEKSGCCPLQNQLFNRINMKMIMTLMKYSLDLSDPWIPQYYNYYQTPYKQTLQSSRNLYKKWLAEEENDLRNLVASGLNMDVLKGWR